MIYTLVKNGFDIKDINATFNIHINYVTDIYNTLKIEELNINL